MASQASETITTMGKANSLFPPQAKVENKCSCAMAARVIKASLANKVKHKAIGAVSARPPTSSGVAHPRSKVSPLTLSSSVCSLLKEMKAN